jgi:hypothetical protein
MKQFLRAMGLAITVFAVAYWILAECVLRFPSVFVAMGYPKEWAQVAQRVESSEKVSDADTLYIGDSVGGQLAPFEGDSSLCSNGAVLVAGNYLLVQEAIRSWPNLRTVVYLCSPQGLSNRFERRRTCNNFMKPFLRPGNVQFLDRSVFDRMDRRPQSYLYFAAPVKLAPFDDLDMSDGDPGDREVLSDFNLHWIPKLDSMCKANAKELLLLSAPLSEGARAKSNDWARMRAQIAKHGLQDIFDPYFRSMVHLPDSLLRDDVHWKRDWMDTHRAGLFKRILLQATGEAAQ